MPKYRIDIPGQGSFEVDSPTDISDQQAYQSVLGQIRTEKEREKATGFFPAIRSGITGLGGAFEGVKYGLGAEGSREAILKSQEKQGKQYQGPSWEDVKGAYEQEGLLSAAGKGFDFAKGAVGQSLPYMATPLAGAAAGTAIAGPVGGVIGAGLGSLGQFFGTNIGRQVQEQEAALDRGEVPQEISRVGALAAAAPQAALDVFALGKVFKGTGLGKLLGMEGEEAAQRVANQILKEGGTTSKLAAAGRGAGRGVLAEVPTEVAQQVLERAQAGLDLTGADAFREYEEAMAGAIAVGGPLGTFGGMGDRKAGISKAEQIIGDARKEFDVEMRKEADRLKAMETTKTSILDGIRAANEREAGRLGWQGDIQEVGSAALDRSLTMLDTPEGVDTILGDMKEYFPGTPNAELKRLQVQLRTYKQRMLAQQKADAMKAQESAFVQTNPDLLGEYRVESTLAPEVTEEAAPAFELGQQMPAPVQGELDLQQPNTINSDLLKNYGLKANTAVYKSLLGLDMSNPADMQRARTIIGDALVSDRLSTKTQEKIDEMARKESRLQEQGELFDPTELQNLQIERDKALADEARSRRNEGLNNLLADLERENAAKETAAREAADAERLAQQQRLGQGVTEDITQVPFTGQLPPAQAPVIEEPESAGVPSEAGVEDTAGRPEPSVGVDGEPSGLGTGADTGVGGEPLRAVGEPVERPVEAPEAVGGPLDQAGINRIIAGLRKEGLTREEARQQVAEATPDDLAVMQRLYAPVQAAAKTTAEQEGEIAEAAQTEGEFGDISARNVQVGAPVEGVPLEEAKRIVAQLLRDWNRDIKVQVVNRNNLPEGFQQALQNQNLLGAKGFINKDGVIFVIANNNKDAADIAATLFHETLGHLGLRLKFKEELASVMNKVYNTNAEIKRLANKWLLDHKGEYSEDLTDTEKRAKAVEEVLAERSEAGRLPASVMDKLKAFINKLARRMGIKRDFSDAEIRTILDQAQKEITEKTGEATVAGIEATRPDTTAFQQWFGDSKVVNDNGEPIVLYTGTSKDVDFKAFKVPKNGVWLTTDKQDASDYAKTNDSQGMKYEDGQFRETNTASRVMPVYAKISNPYTLTEEDFKRINVQNYKRAQGQLFDELRAKGYDGINFGDGIWVVLKAPTQIKSAIGNKGTYSPTKPDITARSAISGAADLLAKTGRTVKQAEDSAPFRETVDRVKDIAKAPAQWRDMIETMVFSADAKLNNAIRRGVLDKLEQGGPEAADAMAKLYSVSTSQALHNEAVAHQFIEQGNVEYNPELFKFEAKDDKNSWANMVQELKKIADQYGFSFPEMEAYAQAALEARRLKGINKYNADIEAQADALEAKGKKKAAESLRDKLKFSHMDDEQIAAGMELFKEIPELDRVVDMWNGIRKNAMKLAVDSGLYTKERAEDLLEIMDYVPFYRVEQLEAKAGPKEFSRGLLDAARDYRFKGSEQEVNNIFDNMERWASYMVRRAVNNKTAQSLVKVSQEVLDEAKEVPKAQRGMEANTIAIWHNGERKFYEFSDPLFVKAFTGLEPVALPAFKALSTFSNALRKNIVLNPLFSISQLSQDSFAAMLTSGLKNPWRLPIEVMKEFVGTLRGTSKAHEELKAVGAAGVRDYSAAISRLDAEMAAGLKAPSTWQKLLSPLEKFSMASDNAVRQAIYKMTMEETGGDKARAVERAFEIINFRRKGASGTLAIAGQVIPFFNAYLQAQNVAYKVLTGRGVSPTARSEAKKVFIGNAVKIAAMSFIYAAVMADDEDYQNMDPTIRDRHWIIPGTGLMLPTRTDLFSMPKIIAEHTYALMTDQGFEDGTKARRAMTDAVVNAITGPTPVPQAFKPLIEVVLNRNFYTGRPIIGRGIENLATAEQFTASTSEFSKAIGSTGLIAPVNVDHLLRGYFGTTGGLTLMAMDAAINSVSGVPKPAKSMQDTLASTPGLSTFVSKEFGNAAKTDFYELKGMVDEVGATLNRYAKTGRAEEAREYMSEEKTKNLLRVKQQVNQIQANLSKLRERENLIRALPESRMDADQKEVEIRKIRETEQRMLANVSKLRKQADL